MQPDTGLTDDGLTGLDDTKLEGRLETESDSVVDVGLPLGRLDATGLSVLEECVYDEEGNVKGRYGTERLISLSCPILEYGSQ